MWNWWSKASPEAKPKDNIDKIMENPWYPLNGPPRNEEESRILTEAIAKEKQDLNAMMATKQRDTQSASRALEKAAKSNCADLEFEFNLCLTTFNFERISCMCTTTQQKYKDCIQVQSRNLQRLGFTSAYLTDSPQLESIVDKADQMYLEETNKPELVYFFSLLKW